MMTLAAADGRSYVLFLITILNHELDHLRSFSGCEKPLSVGLLYLLHASRRVVSVDVTYNMFSLPSCFQDMGLGPQSWVSATMNQSLSGPKGSMHLPAVLVRMT